MQSDFPAGPGRPHPFAREPWEPADDAEHPPSVARAVALVNEAVQAIEQLVAYGANVAEVSSRGVTHYRDLALSARQQVEQLQEQVTRSRAQYEELLRAAEARTRELEQQVRERDRELEKMRAILWPAGRSK